MDSKELEIQRLNDDLDNYSKVHIELIDKNASLQKEVKSLKLQKEIKCPFWYEHKYTEGFSSCTAYSSHKCYQELVEYGKKQGMKLDGVGISVHEKLLKGLKFNPTANN